MTGRRLLYGALFAATTCAMLALVVVALSPGGFGIVDFAIVVLFALTLPWTVIGFWNAVIGLVIMRLNPDPIAALIPAGGHADDRVTASTAILLCIRNELPQRTIRNLEAMMTELVGIGYADQFRIYVLSDTDDAAIAVAEKTVFGALAARWRDRIAVTYRRREVNTGYKAGNIRDFCGRWGCDHDFALVLDADSFMSGTAILRLVRIMQADAKLGILQSLVVGLPSTSAFVRLFQFGMRLGMRTHTIGSAWWQGDCGPYWGHNALIRLAPFIAHGGLPMLSDSDEDDAHILSHDQIEAALIRRAGYDVRVVPIEDGSWEENPPTLLEFIRRDLRWCEGNMQYWRLMRLPGLAAVSRCNIALAILMFVQSPAWIGILVLATLSVALAPTPSAFIRPGAGLSALVLVLLMWIAPVTASAIDVLARPQARRAFGGTTRFLANVAVVYIFSILLGPIMWLEHTIFMIGCLFRRDTVGWLGQIRDDHKVPLRVAARTLWPQTLLGCGVIGLLAATHPAAVPYALFFAAGLALAVPIAVGTALPGIGMLFVRSGVGRLPEETAPPPEFHALAPAAIKMASISGPCLV
jgi:membrane glycosyltransferase